MKTVFSVYNDGTHLACFNTYTEAYSYIEERHERYDSIEEEDFEPACDCGNEYLENNNAAS